MAPLDGLKVLDFSTLLPGPYATMMLADMGADVLRVESPTRPDLLRLLPPVDADGIGAGHAYLNRSKRSIALDLTKPEAIRIVRRLVCDYDVLLEQFRPGVMQRFGLDYQALRDLNPMLVYCSLTGYGQTGPYRDRAGHDINYVSLAGMASYSGYAETGPAPQAFQIADLAGGALHSVIGILAAINARHHTGEGRHVDISMTDATFALNAIAGPPCLVGGADPTPESNLLNGGGFYGFYRTADGRFLSVGSLEPKFRQQLCEAIGRPDLLPLALSMDPQKEKSFADALREVIASRSFAEWKEIFAAADACVEPVLTLGEAASHPQLVARRMTVEVNGKKAGQRQLASAIRFSDSEPEYRHTGAALGAHTEDVLREIGLTTDEIVELGKTGALG
jgi:crotonobetainyl-CoA:carnitine CoA-transferase CaiB-like acyl-CoA transferase